jgi:hypothetical protein
VTVTVQEKDNENSEERGKDNTNKVLATCLMIYEKQSFLLFTSLGTSFRYCRVLCSIILINASGEGERCHYYGAE